MDQYANIKRREQVEAQKLKSELILYRLLYTNWLSGQNSHENHVSFREVGIFMSTNTRTLSRYAKDLVDCGAVLRIRILGTKQCCVAEFGNTKDPIRMAGACRTQHLNKLARTTILMKEWVDKGRTLDWGNSYSNYVSMFFESNQQAEEFYETKMIEGSLISMRTIQRDIKMVRDVLLQEEQIMKEALWGKSPYHRL
ncbi:hypothetical protein SDC9_75338 [bioreactor metagenome]|uniref:Uncharacterized protein n=1 Tax=bioreactor metagenome TaxID=1076179 RepID=A0A644YKH7_9ZZZZ